MKTGPLPGSAITNTRAIAAITNPLPMAHISARFMLFSPRVSLGDLVQVSPQSHQSPIGLKWPDVALGSSLCIGVLDHPRDHLPESGRSPRARVIGDEEDFARIIPRVAIAPRN